MRTYKRKTHRGDTPGDVGRDAVNQVVVGGKSIYRVALDLEDFPLYVSKIRQEGQAIFELKTTFSHRLMFN